MLDDARAGRGALIFSRPVAEITCSDSIDVQNALQAMRDYLHRGYFLAGYLTYEAALAFEEAAANRVMAQSDGPMIWFGVFEAPTVLADISAALPPPATAPLSVTPLITAELYTARVWTIQAFIEAGDIYQANFTFPSHVLLSNDPLAHYSRLRRGQRAGWGAVLSTGSFAALSASPELFFSLSDAQVWAKPMKGTIARPKDSRDLETARNSLARSEKDRAENLMIVDLMRNDIGRVAIPGSVQVPHLFAIETYPAILQMTSTVNARLAPERDAIDLLRAAFPCGSITGAPKMRAQAILANTEVAPRGIYTGSIGFLTPDGDAHFNVAIRTLALRVGECSATLGLGSAITADSHPDREWDECLLKAGFLHI